MATTTEEAWSDQLLMRRTPQPCVLVIFGASGDLAHKKVFPALYSLACRGLLPERFAVVGVARSDNDDDGYREEMRKAVEKNARDDFRDEAWERLAPNLRYVRQDFDRLAEVLEQLDSELQLNGNRVYYLAVPPQAFPDIVEAIGSRRSAHG